MTYQKTKRAKICQFCYIWPHLNMWIHLTEIHLRILNSLLLTHLHHKCKRNWCGGEENLNVSYEQQHTQQHIEHLFTSKAAYTNYRFWVSWLSRLNRDCPLSLHFAFQKSIIPFGKQSHFSWSRLTQKSHCFYQILMVLLSQLHFKWGHYFYPHTNCIRIQFNI